MKPDDFNAGANSVAIDPQNPWLGLFSYSEESRGYFRGRDEETAELARRVQRKLLTVLFGQSGLGKTSLLRAGIVPRLRDEGFCPVYVRVDYAPDSPAPAEQIKQAIFRASAAAGHWTRPGTAVEGESLWEFLHHRGDLLRDAGGHTLLPLLIFDQFEEVFTVAQSDAAGREMARAFLRELADLVENRPPAALETRLETDDDAAQEFDFARADYRVLISLREDYLAHLEALKGGMPSITQNRMRLARMTGTQALSAIVGPGGKLVSQEVAESIVRFVAGGSELQNAEIEPSLLSLVCRELNTVRQTQGRAEISADLLAGSRESILSEFYERALVDQPDAVRRVIEDELLTESGYRESLAEERVQRALAATGAAPDALAKLVDRRLLRIEERLDMRRVELTHDVLCNVVISSRDKRHEREARELAQRQLAEQQAREQAQHRALVRARMVAGVCAALMVVAVASAGFGWVNLQRARAADVAAQKARGDAEKLVGFLIEDFYAELEPTGRLDTLGKLAHRTVAYYDGLPTDLRTPKTQTYRAMALIREAEALNGKGDQAGAKRNLAQARAALQNLYDAGDHGEAVTIALALSYYDEGTGGLGNASRSDLGLLTKSADLTRPLARARNGPREAKLLYANALNYISHLLLKKEDAVATCEEARAVLETLGARDASDLVAAAVYADTADSEARHLIDLGRIDEAHALEQQVYELTEKVLAQRPNDLKSLGNRFYASQLLGEIEWRRHEDETAEQSSLSAAQAGEDLARANPADLTGWGFWITASGQAADVQVDRGNIGKGLATMRASLALAQDERRPMSLGPLMWNRWGVLATLQARLGDAAAAQASLRAFARDAVELAATYPDTDARKRLIPHAERSLRARLQLAQGHPAEALANAVAAADAFTAIDVPESARGAAIARDNFLRNALRTATWSALRLERGAEAETLARRWLAVPADQNTSADPRDESSRGLAALAHALALQSRGDEARTTLQPALDHFVQERQAGAKGLAFRMSYAYALYVSTLPGGANADVGKRGKALAQAAALLDEGSAETQALSDVRELAGWIAAARG